jgi:transcription elongation factor
MSQLGLLIGMPSRITIEDSNGNVIVKEGEIITHHVVTAADAAGRLEDLRMSAAMAARTPKIEVVPEYTEIGEENPPGVHPG